jgi:Tol biopolymer transport system component
MGSDRIPKVYFDPRIAIAYARLSPDEQWLAYAADQSGRLEVYVVSATTPGQTRRVSTNGGTMPRWRRDGRELFYLTPERELISVPVHVNKGELTLGDPTALFTARVPTDGKVFDVADGNHFFVIVEKSPPTDVLSIVLNWAGAQAKP